MTFVEPYLKKSLAFIGYYARLRLTFQSFWVATGGMFGLVVKHPDPAFPFYVDLPLPLTNDSVGIIHARSMPSPLQQGGRPSKAAVVCLPTEYHSIGDFNWWFLHLKFIIMIEEVVL